MTYDSKNNFEKKKNNVGITLLDFKNYYKAI